MDDFGRVLGVENDANKDLNKNVKIVFSLQRESNFQCLEGTKKALNIDVKTTCQACCQELRKILPKISQDGPKREPRWGLRWSHNLIPACPKSISNRASNNNEKESGKHDARDSQPPRLALLLQSLTPTATATLTLVLTYSHTYTCTYSKFRQTRRYFFSLHTPLGSGLCIYRNN